MLMPSQNCGVERCALRGRQAGIVATLDRTRDAIDVECTDERSDWQE